MTRTWLKFALLGAALYLILLVATAPAGWMAWGLARTSHGVLSLNEPAGGVWSGTGELVLSNGNAAPRSMGRVEWTLNPLWLAALRLEARVRLRGPDVDLNGRIGASYKAIRLQDISATASPGLVAACYPAASLFDPSGRFQASGESLRIDESGVQGGLQILWRDAGVNLAPVKPLGDYKLYLDGKGNVVHIKVETLQGSLSVNGVGELNLGNRQYTVSGDLAPLARAGELEPVLRVLGSDLGGGKRKFNLNGRLPI